jgi:hypothetical protein
MTSITASLSTAHRATPTGTDRALLALGRRIERVAVRRMERRADTDRTERDDAIRVATDRRRTAQSLGAFGMLPR